MQCAMSVYLLLLLTACVPFCSHLATWYMGCQYDVCKNYVGSVYVGGHGDLSESGLCVFRELCPVIFLVGCESPSVLL